LASWSEQISRAEVAALMFDHVALVGTVEAGLAAHERGDVVLLSNSRVDLDHRVNGHYHARRPLVPPQVRRAVMRSFIHAAVAATPPKL
jgi:hypothetical protein